MSATSASETIDLRAIFRKLLAKWWLFGITIGLALAAGVAYIKTTPKVYQVQAVILMSERGRNVFGGGNDEFLKGSALLRNNSDIEDQVAVLTSVSNMRKALKRLDFQISYFTRENFLTREQFEYPPFFVRLDTVSVQVHNVPIYISVDREAGTYRVKAKSKYARLYNVQQQLELEDYYADYNIDEVARIGEPFLGKGLSFSIQFPEDREYGQKVEHFFVINSLDGLVANYRARTGAAPISDESSIVVLGLAGEAVAKERMFLDKLLETYIDTEVYRRQQKGLNTIDFIDEQIGQVADSLRQREGELESTLVTGGIGLSTGATTSDALFQERSRLEQDRSQLLNRRQYCISILEKLRSSSDLRNVPAPSSSGIDDPVLNNLVIEITKLSADLAVQNVSTTSRTNPALIAMERRMRNLTSSLEQTAQSLVDQANISLAEVNRRLSRLSYEVQQLPRQERQRVNVERKFKLTDDLYKYLMEKRAEAGIAIASDQLDKYVVDAAGLATNASVKPDKKVILGGAFMIGLLIPMGFILIKDFFNDTVADLDQLNRISPIPVLASIPSSKRKRVLPEEPKSMLAESFRTARINLQYLNVNSGRQVIGFTSSTSGEGKTFCAVNLATVIALSGKRTLIVDADMRRPRLAETMSVAEGQGLSTYLIGECSLDEAIRRSDVQGLDIITAGPIPPNPLELVELERMDLLFKELRSRYDHIIVDASPLGLVSEYVILMRHVDITLYLVRQGYTKRGALRAVNEMFTEKRERSINLLLNDVKQGTGYNEGYGYYT